VRLDALAESSDCRPCRDQSATEFADQPYVGMLNLAHGGEVWRPEMLAFVPLVMKSF